MGQAKDTGKAWCLRTVKVWLEKNKTETQCQQDEVFGGSETDGFQKSWIFASEVLLNLQLFLEE